MGADCGGTVPYGSTSKDTGPSIGPLLRCLLSSDYSFDVQSCTGDRSAGLGRCLVGPSAQTWTLQFSGAWFEV